MYKRQAQDPAAEDPPAEEATPSRITRVVAFPDHAEVTRALEVIAETGHNEVRFEDLVPSIDPNMLRASASEGARITGTEIKTTPLLESLTEEIAALDRALQEVQDALALEAMASKRLQEQAAFYRSIKDRLGRDAEEGFATGNVTVEDWNEVLAFVDEGLARCDTELAALAVRTRELEAQRQTALAERAAYAEQMPKQKHEVTVSFAAGAPGPVSVQIHYMLAQTAWKPSYDVHLDRESGEVAITGYGQVLQWTGELWDDVELTLAMSGSDHGLDVPELTPVVASLDQEAMAKLAKDVAFLQRLATDQVAKWTETRFKGRQERETFRRNLEQLAIFSAEQLEKYGLSHVMIEQALSRLVDRFAAVRYDIGQRATIPFDSSPNKFVTLTGTMPVKLRYVATPALGDSVMLQGVVTNTTDHPILDGVAALFVDDSFVGAATVQAAAQNEQLAFGFGPDDALAVKRRLVSRTVKGPEAFRQSQVLTYQYELTVENFNESAVDVDVADQIPISKTEDIQITFLGSTHDHQHDETSGLLSWTMQVEPGATAKIGYKFSVECPVNRYVHWQ